MSTPFERERDRIIAEMDRAGELGVRDALRRLEQLRREIITEIGRSDLESNVQLMRHIQASVEQDIRAFQLDLTQILTEKIREGWFRGQEMVVVPLEILTGTAAQAAISQETLLVAQTFSADLIQGLSDEIRTKITGILRRMVLGGLTTQEAMDEVGRSLESKGAFSSIAGRAEAIVRTETLRIHSQATQLQMETQNRQMAATGYEILKGWMATHDNRVRANHLLAEMTYLDNPIDVEEPFFVGGEELMYPRDETGSPENTTNCRCVSIPVARRIAARQAA